MKNTDFEKSVKTYERQDPHEVALYQFELTLNDVIKRFKEPISEKSNKELSLQDNKENIIEDAKEFVNILDLSTYDINLLAIAALFDYIYKNRVNQKNVTKFIESVRNTADPIDIIRYIRIYQLLKTDINTK